MITQKDILPIDKPFIDETLVSEVWTKNKFPIESWKDITKNPKHTMAPAA
jgi:hypothetical protein